LRSRSYGRSTPEAPEAPLIGSCGVEVDPLLSRSAGPESPSIVSSAGPRIVAVLATHDGASTLRRAVASVAAQTQPGIELIAVDNASDDGTATLLVDLLGPDRVLVSDRDLGLGGAVDLALDAVDAQDARTGVRGPTDDDLVLILHDDLELERDAVEHLVAALADDDRVAIVGPKLRWADDPSRLQSVGATIDLTGRVDDGIDPGELDQGQRDTDRRVLFVPTAGMLVRRRVFDELGRFDIRAHAFREDLDLCWRAAIAGHDVEVVPAAVGRHASLAAEHQRTGRVAELGPRYLAERNTLAALLTNYGPERLLLVLPLALVVGVAKVIGFVLTRRIADVRDTIAAWGWNLVNLRGTLRRRRRTQRMRRRSDAELAPLFGRITPRLQAYVEAVLDRIAGEAAPDEVGSAETQPSATLQGEVVLSAPAAEADDAPAELGAGRVEDLGGDEGAAIAARAVDPDGAPHTGPRSAPPDEPGTLRRALDVVVARPLQTVLPPTLLLLLVGLRDVVLPGPVRGGDLLPFPDGPDLIARHLAPWHDSGAGLSPLDPSPAQLVLGSLQWLLGGGSLRLLVVAAPLLAWALAMRALSPFVSGVLARTLLALVYAASPPVLAALASGDVVTLVLAVLLPLVAMAASTVLDAASPVGRVWRRIGLLAFLFATIVAFVPTFVVALPIVALAGVGHALVAVDDLRWRRTLIVRSLILAVLPLPLLGPWLLSLPSVIVDELTTPGVMIGGHPVLWLALDPTGAVLGRSGLTLLGAGLVGALVVSVARVGTTLFRSSLTLLALALTLPLAAWWLDVAGTSVRPGPLLLVAAASLVGLAALGLAHAPAVLSGHPFGWRQVGVAITSSATIVAIGVGLVQFALSGTPGLSREDAVPAYLATLSPHPPDRILVVGALDGTVAWEVVPVTGPDLAAFGVRHDPALQEAITEAVDDLLAGSDPRAAARLGRLGIGIVLVPDGAQDVELDARLRIQSALDPLPSLTGSVARVSGGVAGVAIVTGTTASERVPDPTVAPRTVVTTIGRVASDRFVGRSGAGGELLATLPFGSGWSVLVDGAALPMLSDAGLVRVLDVPADAEVEVVASVPPTRTTLLQVQALWALLVVSLAARPPGFALRNARRRAEGTSDPEADPRDDVEARDDAEDGPDDDARPPTEVAP
jgi:GT2 family glycosyltransferase